MPRLLGPSGLATKSFDGSDPLVTGTATGDYSATTGWPNGTATASNVYGAWLSNRRWVRVVVQLGPTGEDITGLIGDVEIAETKDSPVRTASFSLVDARTAHSHASSLAYGGQPVAVWVYMRDESGNADPWLAFVGVTESISNEDPYKPRGSFRAVSVASLWTTPGCVRALPFSGSTRASLLSEFATNAGVGISGLSGVTGGAVRKPVDLSGLTVSELALRWGEIEGWYPRESDDFGSIEILTEDRVFNAPSVFSFDQSNYFAVREDTPDRPTTVWRLSGFQVDSSSYTTSEQTASETVDEQSGTDASGVNWKTTTTTSYVGDVVTKVVIEERKDYAPLGVSANPTVPLCLVQRTTLENTWGQINGLYTNQLLSSLTTIEKMFSPETPIDDVSHTLYVAWTDGTYHSDTIEKLQTYSTTEVTLTWADANNGCVLEKKVTDTTSWYGELNGHPSSLDYPYADGSYRATPDFQRTERITEEWTTTAADMATPYTVAYTKTTEAWRITSRTAPAWNPTGPTYPIETFTRSAWQKVTDRAISAGRYSETTQETNADGSSRFSMTNVRGEMPEPETFSPDVPQFTNTALTVTVEALTDRYPRLVSTDTQQDAESADELRDVAIRRLRDALSVREVISHPAVPLLRAWDPVDVTDPARYLTAASGHVESITRRFSVLNGTASQETTVAIPPSEVHL